VSDRTLRLAVVTVAVAGTAVSAYLTYVHYNPAALVCTRGGGCETVQHSHYATLLGIPVAVYGTVVWVAVLGLALIDSELAWTLVAAISAAALAFAAYLILLQLTVIHAVCWWCMAHDTVLVPALAVLTGLRVLRGPSSSER